MTYKALIKINGYVISSYNGVCISKNIVIFLREDNYVLLSFRNTAWHYTTVPNSMLGKIPSFAQYSGVIDTMSMESFLDYLRKYTV